LTKIFKILQTLRLSSSSRHEKTVGEIVNLMAIDVDRFQQITPLTHQYWSTPLQVSLALWMLWSQIGASVLSGVAVMLLLLPVNSLITMQTKKYQVSGILLTLLFSNFILFRCVK